MDEQNDTFKHLIVVKRSGQRVPFNVVKIAVAIKAAFDNSNDSADERDINKVYKLVLEYIASVYENRKTINVEDIQDIIENTLKKANYKEVYSSFNDYRLRRAASREAFSIKEQHKFVKAIEKIGLTVKNNQESKPMDMMFKFGKTISQEFAEAYLLDSKHTRAHEEGRLFIGSLDSYALGITSSSHLNLEKLNKEDITEFTMDLTELIMHLKEEQYGEHTISDIDLLYKETMIQEFKKTFEINIRDILKIEGLWEYIDQEQMIQYIQNLNTIKLDWQEQTNLILNNKMQKIFEAVYKRTLESLRETLKKNIRKLLTYLEDFNFRLASNIVSISLSNEKDYENSEFGKLYFEVLNEINPTKNVVTIVKYSKEKDNELLLDSIANKRNIVILFPENICYDEAIETFSDGIIINENINGDLNTSKGKILISTTSINLARLGLKYNKDTISSFYEELNEVLELCKNQLIQRFELQANKYKENYDYMFEDEILYDSKKLEERQKVRKIIRNGVLNISFVGLTECLSALLNKDVLQEKDLKLAKEIIQFMKDKIDKFTIDNKLNFILTENCDTKVLRSLLKLDKAMYGNIEVLKKERYSKLSDTLNKLSTDDIYMIASDYQKLCNFNFVINLPKNSSKNKINNVLNEAFKYGIKTLKVQVGKDDN